jgi:hypothetical protein
MSLLRGRRFIHEMRSSLKLSSFPRVVMAKISSGVSTETLLRIFGAEEEEEVGTTR